MIDDEKLDLEFSMLELSQLIVGDNQPAWALVAIPNDKYEAYKAAIASGDDVDLHAHGDILAHRIGASAPTPQEERDLTERFGYIPNLNIEDKLKDILDANKS